LKTNLTSIFLCMREEVRVMRAAGSGGSIVNTASMAALRPPSGAAHYAAAKMGVVGLSQAVAAEVAAEGIRVNALCPGGTDTPMFRGASRADPGVADRWGQRRIATPQEVAAVAVWLCSPDADVISGAAVPADGANQFI
jgi:NAD(P)-dependent dehydrogenase (short-subunit alcohol dehydrogenase family)